MCVARVPPVQDGNTPLHLAATKDHLDVVRVLIHEGADMEATNTEGHSPAFVAAAR